MGNSNEKYVGRMDGPAGQLFGGDAAAEGGTFADQAAAGWLKERGIAGTGDRTAGYRPHLPEQLLRHHDAAAIGCVAGITQVELGGAMAVQIAA